MEAINEIVWSWKLPVQILVVLGWFWLILFTIYRFGCFKKRTFSFLVFVYFGRATSTVSELVKFDFNLQNKLWITIIVNLFTIVGFYLLSRRIIQLQKLKR